MGPCVPTWISRVALLFGFLLFINGVHFVLSSIRVFHVKLITHFITNFDSVRLNLALTSKADDVLFCAFFFAFAALVPLFYSKINIKHLCECARASEQTSERHICKWTRSVVNRAIGNCVEWLLSIKALYALIFILLVDLSHQSD